MQNKYPIVYSKNYNIHFYGIEKCHPFDSSKWEHVYKLLKILISLRDNEIYEPNEATEEELLLVHTEKYLKSLKCSWNVANISEVPILLFIPNFIVQRVYLKPMRYHTKGSMMAGELALDYGWAVNIGGGFHHCSTDRGSGFCPYADITALIRNLFGNHGRRVRNVMVVDLDAHQGNGYEMDFLEDPRVFIMDVYNKSIYPRDRKAKAAIRCKVEINSHTGDAEYLELVKISLENSLEIFQPDLLVYNAGTDVLIDDPLGRLSISLEGVIKRDEIVFRIAREKRIPIVMLTSGGYTKHSALVIAYSIWNLKHLGLIGKNLESNSNKI